MPAKPNTHKFRLSSKSLSNTKSLAALRLERSYSTPAPSPFSAAQESMSDGPTEPLFPLVLPNVHCVMGPVIEQPISAPSYSELSPALPMETQYTPPSMLDYLSPHDGHWDQVLDSLLVNSLR
jgi:hypothetical protein